ncbi:MAG: proprotein convertase P-domain-containing protein [Verrucomicrobiota bacterium]
MKIKFLILMLGLLTLNGWGQTLTGGYTNSTVTAIPDGSPVGVMEQFTVSSLGGSISNVQVTLDITGGFNGDLYAYLVDPQGQMVVLLNRPGVTSINPFGYGDAGMNITLDGLAENNIHDYGSTPGYSLSGTTWAADGRNVNPQAAGSLLYGTPTTATLSLFQNADANGVWTFFIADLGAGGGSVSLNNVILTIMTVPEPQSWIISCVGGLIIVFCYSRHRRAGRCIY